MHWADEGIVLSARRLGETNAVLSILSRAHGRHAGLVRGGAGRKLKGVLQPGNELSVEWRGRLADQLGTFAVELKTARAARLLDDPLRLAGLAAACAMTEVSLHEHDAHPALYEAFVALLDALEAETTPAAAHAWGCVYVRWELGLLAELGFGLDLGECAATGAREGLSHVSPKSGRAVSAAAAAPYAERLLRLPGFLAGASASAGDRSLLAEIADGLQLTGFFLERNFLSPQGRNLPPARTRLVEGFARLDPRNGVNAGP